MGKREDSLCFRLAIMYHELMNQSVTVGIIEISDVEGDYYVKAKTVQGL